MVRTTMAGGFDRSYASEPALFEISGRVLPQGDVKIDQRCIALRIGLQAAGRRRPCEKFTGRSDAAAGRSREHAVPRDPPPAEPSNPT